MKTFVLEKQL